MQKILVTANLAKQTFERFESSHDTEYSRMDQVNFVKRAFKKFY